MEEPKCACAEFEAPKGWINGKVLKGSFFFFHFNLKFILERFLNKRKAVCRWDLHSNSVGPWVHCLGRDLNSQVLKHRELGILTFREKGIVLTDTLFILFISRTYARTNSCLDSSPMVVL